LAAKMVSSSMDILVIPLWNWKVNDACLNVMLALKKKKKDKHEKSRADCVRSMVGV